MTQEQFENLYNALNLHPNTIERCRKSDGSFGTISYYEWKEDFGLGYFNRLQWEGEKKEEKEDHSKMTLAELAELPANEQMDILCDVLGPVKAVALECEFVEYSHACGSL